MRLKFFADHCISNFIIEKLNSILISLNGDFVDIVTYPPVKYKGIIALQARNYPKLSNFKFFFVLLHSKGD